MTATLALTPDGRWDVTVAQYLDAAQQAGFAHVGLSGARATVETATALNARGMRCHELLALRTNGADPLAQARELAAAAVIVGAEWVLTGGFRGAMTTAALDRVAALGDVLATVGVKMAVEFSPGGSVASIPQALEVVEAVGADRAGVLIDTWHFCNGPSTWDDLASIPLERIAYVQFDDALAPASDDFFDETMNRRAMPGDGEFDLDRFAATLRGRGWEGLVSLEVLNAELVTLPVTEFATRAYASSARYWL